jgi:hypothetical protein
MLGDAAAHEDEDERGGDGDGCSFGTPTWAHPAATPSLPRSTERSVDRGPQLSFGHPERRGKDLQVSGP